jgi:hypothetical protein
MVISRCVLLRVRNVSNKNCRDNQNTHFVFGKFLFQKSCGLWDNVEKYCRTGQKTRDNITWRMRIACWKTKGTNTHSECVVFIAFPREEWLRERASLLRYMYSTLAVLLNIIQINVRRLIVSSLRVSGVTSGLFKDVSRVPSDRMVISAECRMRNRHWHVLGIFRTSKYVFCLKSAFTKRTSGHLLGIFGDFYFLFLLQ